MYEQSVFDNGLRVISNRLGGRESVGLAIWIRVGGRYEKKRQGYSREFRRKAVI